MKTTTLNEAKDTLDLEYKLQHLHVTTRPQHRPKSTIKSEQDSKPR